MSFAFVTSLVLLPCLLVLPARAEGPVLIELFTAEGCSSCPPADALLGQISGKTAIGAQLIVLGEHVDYWNNLGWKDRFSSALLTERQNKYVGWLHLQAAYTPEMVIDGRVDVLGNDAHAVAKSIASEAARPKSAKIALSWEAANRLHVTVQAPAQAKAVVILAVTEDGLATSVGGGENKGRTLQHTAVARQFKSLGKISEGSFDTSIEVPAQPDWNAQNLKAVVFVQETRSGEVIGASVLPYR
jgi:hypothetical protein